MRIQTYIHSFTPHDNYISKPKMLATKIQITIPTDVPHATPEAEQVPPMNWSSPPIRHEYQTWNNCGPATLEFGLSGLGFPDNQKEIAEKVKGNPEDKNVNPEELVAYANQKDSIKALVRLNGTLNKVKLLSANGAMVILETWFELHSDDGMGHFRLLRGYNNANQKLYFADSYKGPNIELSQEEIVKNWEVFNNLYIVLYKKSDAKKIETILASDIDIQKNLDNTMRTNLEHLSTNKSDMYAWFNLGVVYTHQKKYEDASKAFDMARSLGLPWRMLWYQFEPLEAYIETNRAQDTLDLVSVNLKQAGNHEESYYFQGLAYQALGKQSEADKSFAKAKDLNPNVRKPNIFYSEEE